jgi:hypothetical protein
VDGGRELSMKKVRMKSRMSGGTLSPEFNKTFDFKNINIDLLK